MGNKLVHFLAKRHQCADYGDDYGFENITQFGCLIPNTKMEPFMAIITVTLLPKPAGVDGSLHDQTIEPFVRPADDVTDVCG